MSGIPTASEIERWEAVANGKLKVLDVIADALANGDRASSSYLRQRCGLSADEWHDAGELIASAICFCAEKGFLEWHAKEMSG